MLKPEHSPRAVASSDNSTLEHHELEPLLNSADDLSAPNARDNSFGKCAEYSREVCFNMYHPLSAKLFITTQFVSQTSFWNTVLVSFLSQSTTNATLICDTLRYQTCLEHSQLRKQSSAIIYNHELARDKSFGKCDEYSREVCFSHPLIAILFASTQFVSPGIFFETPSWYRFWTINHKLHTGLWYVALPSISWTLTVVETKQCNNL